MDTTNSSEKPQRRVKHGQRPTEPLADWPAEFGAAGAEQPAATSGDAPELQQLKALALAATPGEWMRLFGERTVYDRMSDGCRGNVIVRADYPFNQQDAANLDYIAAANPAVVLGLIARIERLTTVPEQAPSTEQEWAKVDPAVAFHLIERHAEDWADAGRMMEAWRAAVSAATKPTADLSAGGLLKMWKQAEADATDTMPAPFQFARSLLATKPAAAPDYWSSQRKMIERAIIGLRDGWATRKDADDALQALAAAPAASTTGAAQTVDQVRNQALEEAAKTAEATRVAQVQYGLSIFQDGDGTRDDIATAIRALKSRPTPTHSSEAGE